MRREISCLTSPCLDQMSIVYIICILVCFHLSAFSMSSQKGGKKVLSIKMNQESLINASLKILIRSLNNELLFYFFPFVCPHWDLNLKPPITPCHPFTT